MSDEAPKSAYEIAMEKLRRQDRDRGEASPLSLSEKQKEAIAAIRRRFDARLAESEILFKAERVKALGNPETTAETLEKMDEEYQRQRRKIEEQRQAEIDAARSGKGAGGAGKGSGGKTKRRSRGREA